MSRDDVRLIARNSMHVDHVLGVGYTTDPARALPGEPEAVSVEAQDEITARSHRSEHAAQMAQWRERRDEIERQLAWLHSQRFRSDVRTQVRALERNLDRIEQKIAT